MGGVGWGGVITFICTSSHTWCYVIVWGGVGWGGVITFICISSHIWFYDATLLYVVLHFLTHMMLRYCMSSCTFSQIWCYVIVCRLALPHIYDASLLYVFALPHRYDATLLYVNQWVFRQSLGPITPIAFLEELKQLLKQWGKKDYEVLLRSSLEQCKIRNVKKHWVFCWKSHFVPRPSIKRVPCS